MAIDPVTGTLIGEGGGQFLQLIGALLGQKGKKEAQNLFDLSLKELESMRGKPIFDVGQIEGAERAAEFPQQKREAARLSRLFPNLDQPRIQKSLADTGFDRRARVRGGRLERAQTGTSLQDLNINREAARLRALQLG
jgi:hypothetical protein